MEAQLFKSRITPWEYRRQDDDSFDSLDDLWNYVETYVCESGHDFIIVKEEAPRTRVEHYHIVGYTTKDRMDDYQSMLRSMFTSRGFMAKFYTEKELISRQPAYYIGYTLKDKDSDVQRHKLTQPLNHYRDFYYNEKHTVSDTYLSFMKQRVTVYDEEKILDSILEYYQHVKTGYDKKSVNKLFHLVRGHLFPEMERDWVRKNKMLLID